VLLGLDCEMVKTTAGLELARVTIVDEGYNVVYEQLVVRSHSCRRSQRPSLASATIVIDVGCGRGCEQLPEHPVVDYVTQFSGVDATTLQGVTKTLAV
jgi:hypothetical protein